MHTIYQLRSRLLAVLLLTTTLPLAAQAQQDNIDLAGKVVDSKTRIPLAGVLIHIQNTTHEVRTDVKGQFKFLTGQRLPVVFNVSLNGYQTKEILITSDPLNIQISLTEGSSQLNDVVVVGYGTQKKSDLTGSVSSVNSKIIKQSVGSSFDRVLQGAVSGVQVTQTSGQPGAAVSIRIRGGNSITGGNEPLYVIDGFPVYNDNSDASAGVTSGPSINALASLNPGDIESIDVLKDASSTAVYGSRGANGVVIITTKKGRAGQNTVTYEGYYGQQDVIKKIDVLTSSRDWALLKNEALINAGKAPYYSDADLAALTGGTDWQDAAFRKAAQQNHQFNISGGDDKTRYSIGLNYFLQDGVVKNTDFSRYALRINLDRNVTSRFKAGVNLTASKTSAQEANSNIVSTLLLLPPTVAIRDENGDYIRRSPFEVSLGNPIATLDQEINRTNTYRVLGNVYGDLSLGKHLTARVSVGADIIANKQNRYIPSTLYEAQQTNGSASVGSKFVNTWLNENTLTYQQLFGKHNVNAVAGFTQQSYSNESVIAGGQGFVSDKLTYNNLSSGSILVIPSSGGAEWALNSYLGRVNYSYDQRYYVTVTARADGSSRFGKDNKWGFFPSAALAWTLSRENFLQDVTWIDNLKLRVSAGITGNQEIGQYKSLSTLTNSVYIIGNNLTTGFYPSNLANPQLGWEKTTQYDAGVDVGILNNRISLTVDAYLKRTSALLLTVPVPYTTGYSTALKNYGTVENKGVEVALNTQNLVDKEVSWTSTLTFSLNRNKVISLGEGVQYLISDPSIAAVGQPLGSFYGLISDGVFKSTDKIESLPTYLGPTVTKPGDRKYVDVSGDGSITQAADRNYIGSAQPKFLAGLINNFAYKGFDLSFFLYTSYGNRLFNQNKQQLELFSGQQNVSTSALNRWTATNENTTIQRAKEDPAPIVESRYVEDASFLRLKNLTFGYTLPLSLLNRVHLHQLRFYVTASNLFTWTNYSGYDPEVSRNEQATLTQGVDYGAYPSAKSWVAGIGITF
ncbi:TonB-dependent receptor [Chitinophaga horti]|uniref:TonB-dependent receptor n=1 Tax=Chitinophaga horti TaxID=2920382 RepID=A0ABY6J2U2_9BACT|nr:TonB-dependent receptor [Chitinophaga horti]UYQ93980.1 TonB-dependent receptor [Chitinophaga horti]